MILLSPEHFKILRAHAERDYPAECCGLLIASRSDPERVVDAMPFINAQDDYHARYPEEFTRTSRTAYFLQPEALLTLEKRMRTDGGRICAIYHSHIDAEAYFSDEDKRAALSNGEPLFPGVFYFVISVLKGKASAWRIFLWDAVSKDFTERASGDFLSDSPFPVQ